MLRHKHWDMKWGPGNPVQLKRVLCVQEDQKSPKDLDFWLEDLYTPGFDSLLKKTEAEHKRKHLCKFLSLVILSICAVVIVVVVPLVVLQKKTWFRGSMKFSSPAFAAANTVLLWLKCVSAAGGAAEGLCL